MNSVIENYINGNITDARKLAKRYGWRKLYLYLRGTGFSANEAESIADKLKRA